jgi:hypothetical protein
VLTLGLGIGATTAMFTVVHGVLLSPLPFDEPDQLFSVDARLGSRIEGLANGNPGQGPPEPLEDPVVDLPAAFEDAIVFYGESASLSESDEGVSTRVTALDALQEIARLHRLQTQVGRDRCVQVCRYVENRFHESLVVGASRSVLRNRKTHLAA